MTGVSPFEPMHGRKMRTKLDVLSPPAMTACAAETRSRVSLRQKHMKQYFDTRRGAQMPSFREGDKVRVCKPVHVLKGHKKFSAPIEIKKQVGPSTYIWDDGKAWYASHLASVPGKLSGNPAQSETEVGRVVEPWTGTVHQTGSRPVRAHHPSAWLKDYET